MTPSPPIRLSGITWHHTRGLLPMVATAQRFGEMHPGVAITWQSRSLQAFADASIDDLARSFDLLVIDHPFVGHAASSQVLRPLDQLIDAPFLADHAAHAVGQSPASYAYDGHLWALAVDAATPVSSWRPDLVESGELVLPRTWDDLLGLARAGKVVVPAIPVDCLMNFYMLCIAHGEEPFASAERVVHPVVGVAALESLRALVGLCPRACLERNPIATYEAMAASDAHPYCPFAFGYSNYARIGYGSRPLRFGGLVSVGSTPLRSTLGGAGLAISHHCTHPELAARYARYVASPTCQRTLYATSGGQPGHRGAWLDPALNALTGGYFTALLPTLDAAFLRPRYDGHLHFQDEAGRLVHAFLAHGGHAGRVLGELDRLYQASLQPRTIAGAAT